MLSLFLVPAGSRDEEEEEEEPDSQVSETPRSIGVLTQHAYPELTLVRFLLTRGREFSNRR